MFETPFGCVCVYCKLISMMIKRSKTGHNFEACISSAIYIKSLSFKLPLRHLIIKNKKKMLTIQSLCFERAHTSPQSSMQFLQGIKCNAFLKGLLSGLFIAVSCSSFYGQVKCQSVVLLCLPRMIKAALHFDNRTISNY